MIKDDLLFLTPYEESIIHLMKNKANHRVLIDNLFTIYEHKITDNKKIKYYCDFYLLSEYSKSLFLKTLSDDDFIYLLNRLNHHYGRLGVCSFEEHWLSWFLFNQKLVDYYDVSLKENLTTQTMVVKSLKILENNKDLNKPTRKLLWAVFLNYYFNQSFYIDDFSLTKIIRVLKKDYFLIKEILDEFGVYTNHFNKNTDKVLVYVFNYFLVKKGIQILPKLKEKLKLLMGLMGFSQSEIDIKFKNVFENILHCSSLDNLPYVKTIEDLDILIREIFDLSLHQLQFADLKSSIKYVFKFFRFLPRLFSTSQLDMKNWRFSFMKVYANIYLNLMKTHFPNIETNKYEKDGYESFAYNQSYRNCIYETLFHAIFSFHYFCYFMPDDVFNKDNPYYLNENLWKKMLYHGFSTRNYDAIFYKKWFSIFVDFKADSEDKIFVDKFGFKEHFFWDFFVKTFAVDLFEKKEITEDDIQKIEEIDDGGCVYEFYRCFNSNQYHPFLGKHFIEKFKRERIFFEMKHWFKHEEYKATLKEVIKKDKDFFSSFSIIDLFMNEMSNCYYGKNNSQLGDFLIQLFNFNSKKTRKLIYQNYRQSFFKYKTYNNDLNHNDNKLLHLWVAFKLYQLDKDKLSDSIFIQSEIEIINKLKKPIKLDYDFYLLKQEIPQIEQMI